MQRENETACELVDALVRAEPAALVDDALPPHPAASSPSAAVAMMAAALRAEGGEVRLGVRLTRVRSFMMCSSWTGSWEMLRCLSGVAPGP